MSLQIILADNQITFRLGAARILSQESDFDVLVQVADEQTLLSALQAHPHTIVVVSFSFSASLATLLDAMEAASCRPILILEHGTVLCKNLEKRFAGVVLRSVTAAELIECVRQVGSGTRCTHKQPIVPKLPADRLVGKVLQRLTPKELQIIALIGEGCKNKVIATQLGTKEQVIKNYLRTIYEKTGVSDRLELALYTLHHRALAQAVGQVRATLERRS